MRPIHKRMPLILHKEDERDWLDCSANPFDKVQSLVKPFPADLMAANEISDALSHGVNIRWQAEYCGTSVAMIGKHYGWYVKSDSQEQL